MNEMDTVEYDGDGFILVPCEGCPIDTSNSTWKVCLRCQHDRIDITDYDSLRIRSLQPKASEKDG